MADFAGKKVVIIGGSRGQGAAAVKRFAGMGADTVFTYGSSKEEADALVASYGVRAAQIDSADRDKLVAFIASEGPIDILVICAGIYVGFDPDNSNMAAIDRMFDINMRSPYFAVVEATKKMPNGGRIILIGSAGVDRAIMSPDNMPYSMAKGTYKTLARYLGYALGDREITVNLIQPGNVDTAMNPVDGPYADYMRSLTPIKRHMSPDEIVDTIVFLAGPTGSMITGVSLNVDGGMGL
jgi:cyclic-di-GMP-binding biofilm dispersal mediator protein